MTCALEEFPASAITLKGAQASKCTHTKKRLIKGIVISISVSETKCSPLFNVSQKHFLCWYCGLLKSVHFDS